MHPQATNMSANRSDDHGFIFEPAGALALNNEFSGLPSHRFTILASLTSSMHALEG